MVESGVTRLLARGTNGLIYVALVIAAMIVGALIGNKWTSTEAAAWFQALGAIVAILGGFAGALFQGTQQTRLLQDEKRREDLEASRLVVALAEDALYAIKDASRSIAAHKGGGEAFSAETDRLDRAEAAMLAVLPTRVPAKMVYDVVIFQRLLTYSLRAIRQREGSIQNFKKRTLDSADARVSEAQERLASLRNVLNELDVPGNGRGLVRGANSTYTKAR
ncbi:hypothetical protein ACTJNK_29745 [Achromobacter anxifer]|uniref:Uncharacterized protein n=1 Tax=Alcaligenes xylosoxydans xylosoxydans TaxID=85698 RepID=A0A424W6H4_ALCXX|nr:MULTISPECIES: hypothetical protein [Achromobacter]MBC9908317.1 hypothetical protein [Achromobacter xylosoxidans]MBD0872087.1 hypothetical protein [Achromobacter xylosoxidans]QNP87624.1 hypothetical protein IAG39_08990 [Achromobacter xylosoxidans]RPJ88830.1 hypothetical protein DY367_25860 [Achromobacter xylosoxidans]